MGKKVSKPVVAPDVKTPQILAEACYEPCEVADLVLLSGDQEHIGVHSALLSVHSTWFRQRLRDMSGGQVPIDESASVMRAHLLDHVYMAPGKQGFECLSLEAAYESLELASKYGVKCVTDKVEEWLCSPLFTPSMPSSDDLDDPDWRDPSSLLSCMELAGKYGLRRFERRCAQMFVTRIRSKRMTMSPTEGHGLLLLKLVVMSPTILTWMIAELSVVYDKNSPLRSLPEQFGAAQVA